MNSIINKNNVFIDLSTNESIFSKLMAIYVKESQHLVKKKFEFKIDVESEFGLNGEEVMIRLSDPNDPFFLYMTSINEQLFNKIKSTENLLIDFKSFPKTIINLFKTCFEDQNTDNPRFMLSLNQMNKDFIVLEIIETNVYKHLIHFSLRIPAANQEFIKSSFSHTFRNLKLENQRLESSLHSLEMRLNESHLSKTKELELIENEYKNRLKELEIRYKKDIECQKHLINELSDKDIQNKELIEEMRKELAINVDNVRHEQRVESERDLQLISDLNRKVSSLEQQLTETKDLYQREKCETNKYKELSEEKQELLDEINLNNNSLTQDLSKANEIIRKLQTEIQSAHQKLLLLNKVTSKQEEAVDQHHSAVQRLEAKLRLCSQQLKLKDKDYETLRKDFDSLKAKCSETESQLNANQNIITYLNKQMNELQAKHNIKTTGALKTGPTVLPKVVEKQTIKTNPKTIAQRNALFSSNSTKTDQLFRR